MHWLLGNNGFQFYTQPCENMLSSVYGQHQRVIKPDVLFTACTISNVPAVLWELVIQNYWFAVQGDPLSNGSYLGTLQRCNADPVFVRSLIASGLGTCLRPEIIFIFIEMMSPRTFPILQLFESCIT